MTPIELRIATQIIDDAITHGYSITVEEAELRESTDKGQILAAMNSTGTDMLYFHERETGRYVGWVQLVFGSDDGSELIADNSVNTRTEIILWRAEIIAREAA